MAAGKRRLATRPGARRLAIAAAIVVAAALIAFFARRPSNEREWAADHAVPAQAGVQGSRLVVRNVRNFRYDGAGNATPGYYDASYGLDSLETVWFALTAFSRTSRIPAHTFVSFGFADGRYLAISIEARREREERYSILRGGLRSYELIYVMGDEKDLVGRRAVVDGDQTYLYPVNAPRERIREMLLAMVARSNDLAARPEFYNSFVNNCASNLVAHVNAIVPGRIPTGLKVLLPGYADEVAIRLGLVSADTNVAEARRRFLVNDRARAAMELSSPEFSAAIRRP